MARQTVSYRQVLPSGQGEYKSDFTQYGYIAMNAFNEVQKQQAEAKIVAGLSQAQLQLNSLRNEYQIKNESDPTGNRDAYNQARTNIFNTLGDGVPNAYKRVWNQKTKELIEKDDLANQTWAFRQARTNSVSFINQSIQNNLHQAYIDGQNFANGDGSSVDAMANFAVSKKTLMEYGASNLGAETTKELLTTYDKDTVKTFATGVAHSNPDALKLLLEDKSVSSVLDQKDVDEINKIAVRRREELVVKNIAVQVDGEKSALDIVNGGDDYLTKRLALDKMQLSGEISDGFATKARRVLSSKKALDATTNDREMSALVVKMYDLNAIASGGDNKSYLIGVRNLREQIVDLQDRGMLSASDAMKLNKQMDTITANKQAEATQAVSWSFGKANQAIKNQLPPEYQGKAIRNLFYKTVDNPNMNKDQILTEANTIINQLNLDRRENTFKKINDAISPKQEIMSGEDASFLKSIGKDDAWVKQMMNKYGKSRKQILDVLRKTNG